MRNIEAAAHTLANIPAQSQTDRQMDGRMDKSTERQLDGQIDYLQSIKYSIKRNQI